MCDLDHFIVMTSEARTPLGRTTVHVGYPFPLASRTLQRRYEAFGERSLGLHYHLDPVDKACSDEFWRQIVSVDSSVTKQTMSSTTFLSACRKLITGDFGHCIYIDPFGYIGDYIQHLQNRDAVCEVMQAPRITSFTRNRALHGFDGLKFADDDELDSALLETGRGVALVIVPNYIDNQWPLVTRVACVLATTRQPFVMAIPGRRFILMRLGNDGPLRLLVSSAPHLRLWEAPVDVMIAEEIGAFGLYIGNNACSAWTSLPTKRLLLFPFSSTELKDIPASMMNDLRYRFGSVRGIEWWIVAHVVHRDRVERWASELGLGEVKLNLIDSVREVGEFIGKADIVIAADSFIAHLCVRREVRVLALYNCHRWDRYHHGSLLHHSLLGFASQCMLAFPMVAGWQLLNGDCQLSDFSARSRMADAVECLAAAHEPPTFLTKLRLSWRSALGDAVEKEDPIYLLSEFEKCKNQLLEGVSDKKWQWVAEWDNGTLLKSIVSLKCSGDVRWRLAKQFVVVSPLWKYVFS